MKSADLMPLRLLFHSQREDVYVLDCFGVSAGLFWWEEYLGWYLAILGVFKWVFNSAEDNTSIVGLSKVYEIGVEALWYWQIVVGLRRILF